MLDDARGPGSAHTVDALSLVPRFALHSTHQTSLMALGRGHVPARRRRARSAPTTASAPARIEKRTARPVPVPPCLSNSSPPAARMRAPTTLQASGRSCTLARQPAQSRTLSSPARPVLRAPESNGPPSQPKLLYCTFAAEESLHAETSSSYLCGCGVGIHSCEIGGNSGEDVNSGAAAPCNCLRAC